MSDSEGADRLSDIKRYIGVFSGETAHIDIESIHWLIAEVERLRTAATEHAMNENYTNEGQAILIAIAQERDSLAAALVSTQTALADARAALLEAEAEIAEQNNDLRYWQAVAAGGDDDDEIRIPDPAIAAELVSLRSRRLRIISAEGDALADHSIGERASSVHGAAADPVTQLSGQVPVDSLAAHVAPNHAVTEPRSDEKVNPAAVAVPTTETEDR